MKIFIAGATGRVGELLIKTLVEKGHSVIAGARHPEQIIESDNIKSVKLDLHVPVDAITPLMQGSDVVYFVAGSRGKDLLQTDAFGAIKTMIAAEKSGIKRYIMLSSIYSLEPSEWAREGLSGITDYNIAKFFADNYLTTNTSLDYTILQPTVLTEEDGTGKINAKNTEIGTNPIPDVVETLAQLINHPNTINKVIMMSSGEDNISDALKRI